MMQAITRSVGILLAVASLMLISAIGISERAEAQTLTNCSVVDMTVDAEEQKFLTLINNYRAQNGRGALTMSTNLNRAASWHAVDMATKTYFSHTDSLGRTPSTRAQNCGYPAGAGENIAAGTVRDTAQKAFDAWKASSGHNANMLNANYTRIGIARYYGAASTYGWYWVTNFGLVDDGTSGGSTGGSTATPTPTPTVVASSGPAAISSPAQGSTLPGTSATFTWGGVAGALEYFVYAGTSQGSNNIAGKSVGLSTSTSVTNVPTNGSTVYVRLWTRFSTGWQYRDTSYKAATSANLAQPTATPTPTPATTTSAKAALLTPAPGSTLMSTTATLSWSAGSGAQEYFLYLGTSQGSNNVYGKSMGLNRSITLSGLPRGGSLIYVRIWTRFSTGWQYNDYWIRSAP